MKIFNFLHTKDANPWLHFAHRLPPYVDLQYKYSFPNFLTTSKVIYDYLDDAAHCIPALAEQILP